MLRVWWLVPVRMTLSRRLHLSAQREENVQMNT